MAVYGFARLVDDVGDEAPPAERSGLLDTLTEEVDRIYAGTATLPITRTLAATVEECSIPAEPLRRLIEANRQDQVVSRYQTFDELLGYCTLSANPVGHLVLYIFGAATPERLALSDPVCTALQLVEHWQDVAEDYARDRIYLPQEDLARFGCAPGDLAAPHADAKVADMIAYECERAGRLLDRGARLVGTLRGSARLAVAGYVAGGRAALAAIARAGHDVLAGPPRPQRSRLITGTLHTLISGS